MDGGTKLFDKMSLRRRGARSERDNQRWFSSDKKDIRTYFGFLLLCKLIHTWK